MSAALERAWQEGYEAGLEAAACIVEDTDVEEARNSYYAQLGDARATLKSAAASVRARINPMHGAGLPEGK